MPYKNRIKTLEESHRLVSDQLFHLEKTGHGDPDKIKKLEETKRKYLSELQQMRRAQYEYDHERVDFEDDR